MEGVSEVTCEPFRLPENTNRPSGDITTLVTPPIRVPYELRSFATKTHTDTHGDLTHMASVSEVDFRGSGVEVISNDGPSVAARDQEV